MNTPPKPNGHAPEMAPNFATNLANAGLENMDDRAARVCANEHERIQEANRPRLAAARAEQETAERELKEVRECVAKLPPEGDLRKRRHTAVFLFAFTLGLCIAGYASAVYALDPLMPGATKYFIALALAVLLPFGVHEVITHWSHSERFMRWLAICDSAIAFVAMIALSFIRSRVFAEQMAQANSAVVIDSDATAVVPPPSTFYSDTAILMTVFSMFSAVGMEIAAGIAFHRACRMWAEMPPNAAELRYKKQELEKRRIDLVQHIEKLEREPEEFVNKFWRDYHEAQMRGCATNRFTKMWVFALLAILLLPVARAHAAEPLNLVIGLDLTASVSGASGFDHKTELQRDVAAVGQLLAAMPAGSRVTVIGITDRSFGQPYVLLSARLDGNEGYFHERVASARQQLVAAWQKRSQTFVENFKQTDLLGALVVGSQVLEPRDKQHNVLVIFSDMRQETRSLNFAKSPVIHVQSTLSVVTRTGLVADLHDVDVYVLGVDAAGKNVPYWNSLREFWLAYFKKAGANVREYSMLRELPELGKYSAR